MSNDDLLIDSLRTLFVDDDRRTDHLDSEFFATGVMTRVEGIRSPRTLRGRRRFRRFVASMLVVVAAVVPGPRTALAHWLGIGSVRIERQNGPVAGLPANVHSLDLGRRSTIAEASRRIGRSVAVAPGESSIGVWLQDVDGTPTVNSVYVQDDETILVNELPGAGNVFVSLKVLGRETKMEMLTIANRPAVWFSDSPHEVASIDRSGQIVRSKVRLAGNVLLWADDQRTIRIEGLQNRDAAIAFLQRMLGE